MVVNRGSSPSAQETFAQMAQEAGLRGRVFLTLGILLLVRLGIYIPIPGINREAFAANLANNQLAGFLNVFTGGGIASLGVFMLGILPYINASIIIQLLTSAVPALENLQKNEGEAGRRQITQYTRYLTLAWAIIQGVGVSIWVYDFAASDASQLSFTFETTLALTAGSMFVMWASELITERGIGNGASLMIFLNIVASLPTAFSDTIALVRADSSTIPGVVLLSLTYVAMIVCIVFVQEGTRRIPIISAKRQVGRRLYREQKNYLPLRLNQGGVMPIIFASAVLILPTQLQNVTQNLRVLSIISLFSPGSWGYIFLLLVLIVFFSYFYASLIINPIDLAQNLKKMGSSIPGIRPGKATSDYIEKVLNRLTLLGAIFLGLVAVVPSIVEQLVGITTFQGLGATSLLILVGVAIDTSKQIQTYVISQRYEGMVKS
ncbi:MAG: preprotein translocase subunit SecY [Synechococcus sp.]